MKSKTAVIVAVFVSLCVGVSSGLAIASMMNFSETTTSGYQTSDRITASLFSTTTVTQIRLIQPTTTIKITNTMVQTVTSEQVLYVPCEYTSSHHFRITSQPGTTAILCVQFFYYSANQTIAIAPLQRFSIYEWHNYSNGTNESFDASSNFTISAKPSENITVGGPKNMNEGALVVYSFTPKPKVTGVFGIDFGWLAPQVMKCGIDLPFFVGNVSNTQMAGSCIAIPNTCTSTATTTNETNLAFTYSCSKYPLPEEIIFAELVGGSNGTSK